MGKKMPCFIGLLVGRLGTIMFLIPILLYLRLGIESLRNWITNHNLSQISKNVWANIYEIGTVIHLQDFWWKWTVMLCKQTLHCCLPILYNNLQGKNINFDFFSCLFWYCLSGGKQKWKLWITEIQSWLDYMLTKISADNYNNRSSARVLAVLFFFIGTQSCNQASFYQPWSKSKWGSHYFWIINSIMKIDK